MFNYSLNGTFPFCQYQKYETFCAFGVGDCGAKSVSTSEIINKQVINNSSDLTSIKEVSNKKINESIKKNSAECNAKVSAKQTQKVDFSGAVFSGKAKIGVGQQQDVAMNLSCAASSTNDNDFASDIANSFGDVLEAKFDTDALAKLGTEADSKAVSGFLPTAASSSTSNSKISNDLQINNNISKTLKNTINNEIKNSFTTETMHKCLADANLVQENDVNFSKTKFEKGSDVELQFEQKQSAKIISECISNDTSKNKTIDKVIATLNTLSVDGITTKSKVDAEAKSTSSAISKGLDSLVDSLFSGLASMLGVGAGMVAAIVIAMIIVVGIVLYMIFGSSSKNR